MSAQPDVSPTPSPGKGKWKEIRAAPAKLVILTASVKSHWFLLDDETGAELRVHEDGKTASFVAPKEGRYRIVLLAYTAAGDVPSDPARVVVVIDGTAPPDPTAPDELKKKIRAAYEKDKPTKADALQLAAIYREAAKLLADPEVLTSKELLARLRTVSASLLGADALPAVRGAAAEELLAVLGMTSDEALTEAKRKKAAELFLRFAALLDELTK